MRDVRGHLSRCSTRHRAPRRIAGGGPGWLAFPGLGTGVGRIGAATCARQVRAAIEDSVLGQFKMPQSWAEASERHQLLYTDTVPRLQY